MKTTKVKINGKIYSFKYTVNSLCELEEATEYKDINQLMAAVQTGSIAAIRAMVWAGLIWEKPELTMEEVGEFMGGLSGMTKFAAAIGETFSASSPEAPKGDRDTTADPTK